MALYPVSCRSLLCAVAGGVVRPVSQICRHIGVVGVVGPCGLGHLPVQDLQLASYVGEPMLIGSVFGHYPIEQPGLRQMQDTIADFLTSSTSSHSQ
ncbi:hypothetical protein [Nocardia abscessus]|uniref:hypothetical protein n=1 Tax=Nocardia abscessus TaxID=120957 RepID=UPI002457B5B9|nr:hypothetical protein [Nocardia abscessus]